MSRERRIRSRLLLLTVASGAMLASCKGIEQPGPEPTATRRAMVTSETGQFQFNLEGKPVPIGPGVETGVEYPYDMPSHCGVKYAAFDGRWWSVVTKLPTGPSGSPPGLDYNSVPGTMSLVSRNVAVFVREADGQAIELRPTNDAIPLCI